MFKLPWVTVSFSEHVFRNTIPEFSNFSSVLRSPFRATSHVLFSAWGKGADLSVTSECREGSCVALALCGRTSHRSAPLRESDATLPSLPALILGYSTRVLCCRLKFSSPF